MTLALLPSHSETGPASLRISDRERQHLELHNWRGRVGTVPGPLFIGDRGRRASDRRHSSAVVREKEEEEEETG